MISSRAQVFLVDDDPAVRDSLSLLIESEGYEVSSFADPGSFLVACGPDIRGCAVIDLKMPDMDGLELQAEMARRGLAIPVIFLTGFGDIPTSVKAIKGGAVDFLTKPVSGVELLRSVASALELAQKRIGPSSRYQGVESRLASLTDREQSVMRLAVAGLSNKEIARQLGISHRTVEIHKAHVMRKTGAGTIIDLVRMAGQIAPGG